METISSLKLKNDDEIGLYELWIKPKKLTLFEMKSRQHAIVGKKEKMRGPFC